MRLNNLLAGAASIALASSGCLPAEYDVEVTVRCPDVTAATGVVITVLPFDRDALRDSIAAASDVPRPRFRDLENELASYVMPDLSGLGESFEPWRAIYDSVQHLADSLSRSGADSSARYANAYDRLRDQYQHLAQRTVQRDAAIRDLVGDDKELAMRVSAAADSLRAWEGVALAPYPELADSAIAGSGRGLHRATTGERGTVELTLKPGDWWLVAQCSDPNNPFIEHYWNVPARVRLFSAKSIVLDEDNGISMWRY